MGLPGVESFYFLFQVRFIFPGTAAANNGNVFCGDYIFAVNGVKLYKMSHPQAIHILKKCTTKCKLIVFREIKENPSKRRKQQKAKHDDDGELKIDIIPGAIPENNVQLNTNQMGNKVFQSKFPAETEHPNDDKEELNLSEETEDDTDQQDSFDNAIPQCISTNKRTQLGPFMIEHDKKNKLLGIDVMMDQLGQCIITDILPNGSVVNDKRIR